MNRYKVGDIVEQVVEPLSHTARGGICSPDYRWFFHLWRAKVVEVDFFGQTKFDVLEPVILQPDDPRVMEFLREHFTPFDYLMMRQEENNVLKPDA